MICRTRFILVALLLGAFILAGAVLPVSAQETPSYLYVTEWQIPHAQWSLWQAFEESSYKPMFEKLMQDHTILSWGLYTHEIHTPEGPTHGLWFSATGMKGIEAALAGIDKLPVSSVMNNPQVKQRDLLYRSLASAGRGATGTNGTLWVHRTQSGPGKHEPNLAVWDKYVKPMLDEMVAQGTILSYGVETEQIRTQGDSASYIYCLMPGSNADDKFFSALDGMQSKMTTAERNEFNAAELRGEGERLGHVTFFSLADPLAEK
jgi:hypothetical protein